MIFYPKKFKAIRQSRDLTQVKVAEALGIKYQSVQGWEHGKVNPSKQNIYKLADLLNCNPEDFASFEEDEIVNPRLTLRDLALRGSAVSAELSDGEQIEAFRAGLLREFIFSDLDPAAKEKALKIISNFRKDKKED